MHLWCTFFVSRPMFADVQLHGLHSVINGLLPNWSVELRAARDEDSPKYIVVRRQGRLYDCIQQVAPPKRGLGWAVLTGSYGGLSFFVMHCEGTLPPELNETTIEVYGPSTVEGQATSAWARRIFEVLAARLPVRYARANIKGEFDAKNLVDDETGVRAIGVLLAHSLPGLYWLNYFGAPYVDLIGRERLLTEPAYEVKPVGDGVLLALDASPDAWQTAAYKEREAATIAHLGKQFFFSRSDPERKTIAPDFLVSRDRPKGD